jgi:hypothetical protein
MLKLKYLSTISVLSGRKNIKRKLNRSRSFVKFYNKKKATVVLYNIIRINFLFFNNSKILAMLYLLFI